MPDNSETFKCSYCWKITESWQAVGQIPTAYAPQEFIINNILSFDGNALTSDVYLLTTSVLIIK